MVVKASKSKEKSPPHTIRRSDPTPIYKQIANHLKERIDQDDFKHDKRLPSSRDLAEFYRVNHLTVRQALKYLEQEGIIGIAHGRGSFIKSNVDTPLRTALLLPALGHEQSGIISRAVQSELGGEATVHVMDYHGKPSEEAACLLRIAKDGYNSAIIYSSMRGEAVRLVLQMIVEGFPLVLVDRFFGNVPAAYVLSDNRNGGYVATRHLLQKGCRRIACFTTDLPNVTERYAGYRDALAEVGVLFDKSLVVELPPEGDLSERATTNLLKARKDIDGIFFYNDYEALKGMKQIKAAGLRIPEDIRVVGFDDLQLTRYSEPTLTSIRQNHEQVGREAARLLVKQLKLSEEERFTMQMQVIPVELIERESA